MNNFSKYDFEFIIEGTIKVGSDKSLYEAKMINKSMASSRLFDITCNKDSNEASNKGSSKALSRDVIIIRLHASLSREIEILISLNYKGIPKNLIFWQEGEFVFIVQEKIRGKNLLEYIIYHKNLPANKRLMIAYDVANTLNYLHSLCQKRIIHGDISPNNILISDNEEVYLIDFGSSFYQNIVKKEKAYYGTSGYFSPSIISDPMSVDRMIDIYSYSMVLKLLKINQISIDGHELYIKCFGACPESPVDLEDIMEDILQMLN